MEGLVITANPKRHGHPTLINPEKLENDHDDDDDADDVEDITVHAALDSSFLKRRNLPTWGHNRSALACPSPRSVATHVVAVEIVEPLMKRCPTLGSSRPSIAEDAGAFGHEDAKRLPANPPAGSACGEEACGTSRRSLLLAVLFF
jgi:hypothetical protein